MNARSFIVGIIVAGLFLLSAAPRAFAVDDLSGTWSIQPSRVAGSVHLELRSHHTANQDGDSSIGQTMALARLTLTAGQLTGPSAQRSFTLISDAGKILFSGSVGDDVGAGHYVFEPSASYRADLQKRGISVPPERKLVGAAILDVSIAYIDGIAAAGFPLNEYDQLLSFRALHVTAESARALRVAFGTIDAGQVLELTALHITPQYAAALRAAGADTSDVHRFVEMKALGIDADYVRSLRAQFPSLSSQDAIQFKALHVDAAYVAALASVGYTGLTSREVTELKALNIDKEYILRLQRHGFKHVTPRQLVELKASGV